ncbi:hypothetical protein SAMN04489729_0283 [Amycolatopsis lurida]|uniref:Uncharacterized protein n=1 Tax=Amycolatopsis lurida NRRL 2430 TaxID=1460371 RepID=A0A2P2FYN9_AMYLU|nr:hypothetical protein [Amycolatopsis lurida]KFU81842.1 hypothetical protein BB31_08315 [Amycolatopsis lurida NRRL 2430]SEB32502.1 hypothetical protein SAMN04489729_0283 [Amycolatopsis lurida]
MEAARQNRHRGFDRARQSARQVCVINVTGSAACSIVGTLLGRHLTMRGLGIGAAAVLGTGGGVIVGAADAAWV